MVTDVCYHGFHFCSAMLRVVFWKATYQLNASVKTTQGHFYIAFHIQNENKTMLQCSLLYIYYYSLTRIKPIGYHFGKKYSY